MTTTAEFESKIEKFLAQIESLKSEVVELNQLREKYAKVLERLRMRDTMGDRVGEYDG